MCYLFALILSNSLRSLLLIIPNPHTANIIPKNIANKVFLEIINVTKKAKAYMTALSEKNKIHLLLCLLYSELFINFKFFHNHLAF